MGKFKKKLIIFLVIVFFIVLAILIQRLIYHQIDNENKTNEVATEKIEENKTTPEVVGKEENKTTPEVAGKEEKIEDDGNIKVVPTMSDKLGENAAWCGTMQLAWNEMLDGLVGNQEIVLAEKVEEIENLNKKEFTKEDISEKDTYQTYGLRTNALKEKIEKEIKDKFNETSDILDSFDWYETEEKAKNEYFFYAILKKAFTFEYEFEDLDKGTFENGKYENVSYFGVNTDSEDNIKDQIRILYYNSDEDFAVSVETKEGEELILCNNPEGESFNTIYENINSKSNQYSGIRVLEDIDDFKMPNIKIDLEKSYEELQGKKLIYGNGNTIEITQALQTIQFELDKKGGSLKSEAGIAATVTSMVDEEPKVPKHLYLDDSFVMFLVEDGKDKPYYASKITDITKFQK